MGRSVRTYFILSLLTVFLAFSQNCNFLSTYEVSRDFLDSAKTQDSDLAMGNGETYEGKLNGIYERHLPDYTCNGVPMPVEVIEVSDGGVTLTRNIEGQCNAKYDLQSSTLVMPPNIDDLGVIGLAGKNGIYVRKENNGLGLNERVETWCVGEKEQGFPWLSTFVIANIETDQRRLFILSDKGSTLEQPLYKILDEVNVIRQFQLKYNALNYIGRFPSDQVPDSASRWYDVLLQVKFYNAKPDFLFAGFLHFYKYDNPLIAELSPGEPKGASEYDDRPFMFTNRLVCRLAQDLDAYVRVEFKDVIDWMPPGQ